MKVEKTVKFAGETKRHQKDLSAEFIREEPVQSESHWILEEEKGKEPK